MLYIALAALYIALAGLYIALVGLIYAPQKTNNFDYNFKFILSATTEKVVYIFGSRRAIYNNIAASTKDFSSPRAASPALGPSALGQHWKLLASAHHLIKPQCGVDGEADWKQCGALIILVGKRLPCQ